MITKLGGDIDTLSERLNVADRDIRVLHVDDDPQIRDLAASVLEDASDDLSVVSAPGPAAALERLEESDFDCIVSDFQMPETDGLEFFDTVRKREIDIPFILFTGKGSEEIAARAIKAGVSDYLQKESGIDHYTVLRKRIETAVVEYRAQRRVHQSIQALEAARDGIAVFDADGQIQYLNDAYARAYGYEPSELLGGDWEELYPQSEADRYKSDIEPTLQRDGGWTDECECLHRDGTVFRSTHSISLLDDGGHICIVHHGSVSYSE